MTCLEVIEYLQPKLWYLEDSKGLLLNRDFMQNLSKHHHECSECRYRVWTNAKVELKKCLPGAPCYQNGARHRLETLLTKEVLSIL
jgi:hypothetical protein